MKKDPNTSWLGPPLVTAVGELDNGGSIEAVMLLLRYGAVARVALPTAISANNIEAVRMLLAAGADLGEESEEGGGPFKLCVLHGTAEMMAMLPRCGGRRNIDRASGYSGLNALGAAVDYLNLPIVKLLLKAGADPMVEDFDHQIACECLPKRNETNAQVWDEIAALLPARKPRG